LVLAFGAGALISVVSFELAEEGIAVGSLGWTAVGLAGGALA
jgi:ZIP family zinc transporter